MGKIKEVKNDECDYENDYIKIKFNSDNDLPLKEPLKFHLIIYNYQICFQRRW